MFLVAAYKKLPNFAFHCCTIRHRLTSAAACLPAHASQRCEGLSTRNLPTVCRRTTCCSARDMASEQNATGMYQATPGFTAMIPPLDGSSHKGQHGKVTVIGGSSAYTGAPYFAAFSAMQVKDMLALAEDAVARASCLVIGPGLSRDSLMITSACSVLTEAIDKGVPIVIDADGIAVVEDVMSNNEWLFKGVSEAVLTPNVPEFWRLCDACGIEHHKRQPRDDSSLVQELANALDGPVVVAKGRHDTICRPGGEPVLTTGKGSPRRCGGQGDILSGTLGTTTSWAVRHASTTGLPVTECIAEAALNACELVRVAQQHAFEERGRSMVASDIVRCLQPAVAEYWSV